MLALQGEVEDRCVVKRVLDLAAGALCEQKANHLGVPVHGSQVERGCPYGVLVSIAAPFSHTIFTAARSPLRAALSNSSLTSPANTARANPKTRPTNDAYSPVLRKNVVRGEI